MSEKASALPRDFEEPRYWEKRVSAAYLRMLGATQDEAASAVDRSERTIRNWESHESWPYARRVARSRWLTNLTDRARSRLLSGMSDPEESASLALRVLERLDEDLAPAAQKLEHTGRDGGPIEYTDLSDEELEDRAHQLKNRLAALTASENGDGHG